MLDRLPDAGLLAVLTACIGLTACASVEPYQRPEPGLGVAERAEIYARKSVQGGAWNGYQVGGRPLMRIPRAYSSVYADYFEASGDTVSAAEARRASSFAYAGLAAGLGGVLIGVLANGPEAPVGAPFWAGAGTGLLSEVVLIEWGRRRHFVPAVEGFNRRLRDDLGLDEEQLVTAEALKKGPRWVPGTNYVGMQALLSGASTYDLADYYDRPWLSPDRNGWPESWAPLLPLQFSVGRRFEKNVIVEFRAAAMPRGKTGLWYPDGTPARIQNTWAFSYGLMPAFPLASFRSKGEDLARLYVGFELGMGWLMSKASAYSANGAELGSYYLRASAVQIQPLVRLQSPSPWRQLDFTMDLGYRFLRFGGIQVQDASGTFAGRPSPEQTLRGTEAAIDLSGPFLAVGLEWSLLGAP